MITSPSVVANVAKLISTAAAGTQCGGGFLGGSQAQEESLARSSNLHACIRSSEMYTWNRRDNRGLLYHDAAIYTPRCVLFRDDAGRLRAKPRLVGVCSIPAPNAGWSWTKEDFRFFYIFNLVFFSFFLLD